jgi:5'-phosphate synthase pdxT subunit
MTVGILALQGNFAEHCQMIEKIGHAAVEVRTLDGLALADRLILPGGESTVIGRLLQETGIAKEIIRRQQEASLPLYGTCAGAILLAREVVNDDMDTLGLINISITRNAYGRQPQSFRADLAIRDIKHPVPVSFIRAPQIVEVGEGVEVLAEHEGLPVLVRQGSVLVGTFHSELTGDASVHELFVV